MCGIYLTNIPTSESEVIHRIEKIGFRGPDHTGVENIGNVHLAHLRLSILDLDPRANQPMNFRNLWITYNGEIYNFLEVKSELQSLGYTFKTTSDTEVLLVGFFHWGKDLLEKINGMFAFAIYNRDTKKVFCARDRLGVKPLYYYWEKGKLEICSQLKPIANNKNIFEPALAMFFETRYVPSPYSIYKNVFKLPPGNYAVFDLNKKKLDIKEYWNLQPVSIDNIPYNEAKEKLSYLLNDAVKIRLQSDVPIGSFLSGGIDSAIVSAIAAQHTSNKLKTFTIGFENPDYNESQIAEQYAQIIGSEHITTVCSTKDILEMVSKVPEIYDEPFADESALPSLLLNKVTKKHVTVALSGDGGDESFIGYNHFNRLQSYFPIYNFPLWFRKLLASSPVPKIFGKNSPAAINSLVTADANELIRDTFLGADSIVLNANREWFEKHYSHYKKWAKNPLQRAADLNIKLWLENDSNVKVDRASMAYSVEVRSPFLDYRIIEFARKLPLSYRYKKGMGKIVVKDLLKEFIPENIFNQPKRGFAVPLGDWMRNELKEDFISELDDDFLNNIPYLNVKKFKNQLNNHMNGTSNFQENIWKMYVLKKWLKS